MTRIHHALRAAAGNAGGLPETTAFHRWALVETGNPYEDTGTTGGLDASETGTVAHATPGLGSFSSAISLSGAGAIEADDVLDSLFTGADAQFRIKVLVEFSSLSGTQVIVGKFNDGTAERQFYLGSSGSALRFAWYGSLSAASFRVPQTSSGAVSTGVTHEIELIYDGTIDSNDGLDRVTIKVDGVSQTTTMIASQGTLHDIVAGPAHLAFGASVNSNGGINAYELNGKMNNVEIFSGV